MEIKQSKRVIEVLFLAFFLMLPFIFFKEVSDPFLLARHFFTNVFLILMLLYVVLKKIPFGFAFTSTGYFFLGLVLIGLISFPNSDSIGNSHYAFSKQLTFFTYFMFLTGLLYNEIISIRKLKTYLIYFSLISLTITLFALLNKTINGQNLFRQVDLISGTFANKNLLSSLLFCTLPFYFVGISLGKRLKIICVWAIILTVFVLIILRTRTVLIATAIFLLLALCYELRQGKTKRFSLKMFLFGAIVLVCVCAGWFFIGKTDLHSSSDISMQYFYRLFDTKTLGSRTLFWNNSFKMIGDNFLSGVGVGNWITEFPAYGLNNFTDYGIVNGTTIVTNPHNDFLLVFCETGIIGIICYLGIFASIIYQLAKLIKTSESASDKKMFFFFLAFVLGYLIIAFFDFPLERIEHQIVLLTVFGIVNAYSLKSKNTIVQQNKFTLISFGIILLYSTTVVLYRINGEKHTFRMLESRKQSDWEHVIAESNLAENYFFKTDGKSIPLEWYKAAALFKQNQIKESCKKFLEAHKTSPYNITILNDLGSSCTALGQNKEGIKWYKKALQISENYENARLNLAAIYFNEKEYEMAFGTIDQCKINSKNENYKVFLAPIVEKKLNLLLEKLNNAKLNSYLQNRISDTDDLIELYFDARKKGISFEEHIQGLNSRIQ